MGKNKKEGVKTEKVKQEFDNFAKKIARLETLRRELEVLDTRGFDTEVKLIKAKLKDVNAIPEIERDIKSLANKVQHKSTRAVVKNNITKQLIEKSKSLEEDHSLIKKKISELAKELEDKQKLKVKKQLSSRDVEKVHEIPQLEGQLKALRGDFIAHTRAAKVKIDAGVGTIVDSKFDDFVTDIKSELTDRLKAREVAIDAQLQADLEEREKLFAKRYKEIAEELHEQYKDKVQKELQNEVKIRFEQKLRDALEKERHKLVEELVNENSLRLSNERKQLVNMLAENYGNKEKALLEKAKIEENKLKQEFADKKSELAVKISKLDEEEKEFTKKIKSEEEGLAKKSKEKEEEIARVAKSKEGQLTKRVREKESKLSSFFNIKQRLIEMKSKSLANKRIELNRKMSEVEKDEKKFVSAQKLALANELKTRREQMTQEFNKNVSELKSRMHETLVKEVEKSKQENESKMQVELNRRASRLKSELEKEYKEKLTRELKIREGEIEKKKQELELHVMAQAKKLFNH